MILEMKNIRKSFEGLEVLKDISFGVENSYETKKIDISATKTWTDANNQDGKRGSVDATIQL